MSYTNIPSQYIRTELTPANIKQALIQLCKEDIHGASLVGREGLTRHMITDFGCDTNIWEDLFQHFFLLNLSVDFIGMNPTKIKVRTWKNIYGKDDGVKLPIEYTIDYEFVFKNYDISFNPYTETYHNEQTVLENIQEKLYLRASSIVFFYDQCE